MNSIIPIFGLAVPYIVWGIEVFLPYPHIIEELAKIITLSFVETKSTLKTRLTISFLVGLGFSISETIFFFFKIIPLQQPNLFLIRFVLTSSLHITTCLILSACLHTKSKPIIILGFIAAVVIHFLYNTLILTF